MAEEKLDVQTAGFEIQARDKMIRIDNSSVNIYSGDGGPLLKEVLSIVQKIRMSQKLQQKDLTEIKVAVQALVDEPAIKEKIAKMKASIMQSDQSILDEMKPDHNPPLSTDKK